MGDLHNFDEYNNALEAADPVVPEDRSGTLINLDEYNEALEQISDNTASTVRETVLTLN